MAITGRKRKWKAQRRQTTTEGRKPKQKATVERLAHFEAATGRKRANNYDNEDTTVIHLLYGAELITEAQKSAALDYAALYWHNLGQVFKFDRAVSYAKQLVSNGSVRMPSEVLDEKCEARERRFRELDSKLSKEQRLMVHMVALDDREPMFFIKHRKKQEYSYKDLSDKALLHHGLNALIK